MSKKLRMDYLRCTVEDLLMDPGFCNYCLHKHPADVAFWEDWLKKHPEKEETIREAKALYRVLNGNVSANDFEKDYDHFQRVLAQQIEFEAGGGHIPRKGSITRLPGLRYIAAAVFFGFAAIAVFVWKGRPGRPAKRLEIGQTVWQTRPGERKQCKLPDGTIVRLNAGSRFTISAAFGDSARQSELEGEAFFDVAKDVRHPFVIHTSAMDVRVLGTSFNVRSYKEDAAAETSLITGAVEVTLKDGGGRRILLKPSEKISLPNQGHISLPVTASANEPVKHTVLSIQKLVVTPVDSVPAEISWTMNCLRFTDQPMEQIAEELERWYAVTIRFEDETVKQYRYTASFEKKSIDQVLKALALSRPFRYYWDGPNKIVIRKGNAMKN